MKGTVIGDDTVLQDYVNTSGPCKIGNNVIIKRQTMIGKSTIIKDNVLIGSGVTTTRVKHMGDSDTEELPVIIGPDCKIGSRTIILAGIVIGPGVEIGAGSLVTKDCIEPGIYIGSPAKKKD